MDSFGALAHGGWWAVSYICLHVGVVPQREEVSFSLSVVGAGGWVDRLIPYGSGALTRFMCYCSL